MDDNNNDKTLSAAEIRILGCLIEKQHTTPNQYPLTLNSLQLACNQKTSRNPIMQLEVGEIGTALNQLIDDDWVAKNPFSARADKYEQKLDRKLGLSEPRLAILCVLMLRADQTLAEIKNHTQRIYTFSDVSEVKSHIDGMMLHDENPLITELPKKPGTKETRYAHLLGGEIDRQAYLKTPVASAPVNQPLEALQARIEILENRIAQQESHLQLNDD